MCLLRQLGKVNVPIEHPADADGSGRVTAADPAPSTGLYDDEQVKECNV